MGRIINVGLWEQIAKAIFGTTGGNPIPELGEKLQPCVVLQSDRPEWSFNAGEHFWGGKIEMTALAANFSMARIHNPSSSGMLSVITHAIFISGTGSTVIDCKLTNEAPPSPFALLHRDTRWSRGALPSTTRVATQAQGQQNTVQPGGSTVVGLPPTPGVYEINFILEPGTGAFFVGQVVNLPLSMSFIGYEKPLWKGRAA